MNKHFSRYLFLIAASLFFWGFYLKLLSPTVTLKDSGELITAAYALGIAHPPGYPLYSLFAHLFCQIPLGEIAFRVNAFSAFFGVIGLLLCALIIFLLGGGFIGVVAGVGLVGSAHVTLSTALVSEVYTFEIAVLLLSFYWLIRATNYRGAIFSLSLLLALHPKNIIYFLPLFLFFLFSYQLKSPKKILGVFLIFIMLLGVYLYLPLRAKKDPALNWNRPASFSSMLFHLSGKEYQGRILKPGVRQVDLFKKNFALNLIVNFSWFGLILGLGGLISLFYFRQYRLIFLFVGISFLNLLFGIMALDPVEGFLTHFYLPVIFIIALLVGEGVRGIPALIYEIFPRTKRDTLVKQFMIVVVLSSFAARIPKVSNFPPLPDRHNDYVAYDFAANQVKSLLPNALLFAVGTRMTFPIKYLLLTQNRRPDIMLVEGGFLKPVYRKWYLPSLKLPDNVFTGDEDAANLHSKLINYYLPRRPLFFAPVYLSDMSPLNFKQLPKEGRFLDYGMGGWLLPAKSYSNAKAFLYTIGIKSFVLRSYYQPIYRLNSYERYVFRKYDQFFRRTGLITR